METPEYTTLGFIGLGTMGFPMAKQLTQKMPSHVRIYIFDVVKKVSDELSRQTQKVQVCSSAKEVAENSDIILTMVPEGSHVRSVYLDSSEGVIAADISNKLLIDCSTIDMASNQAVRELISAEFPTAAFYDAPVSGGPLGAGKGSLAFMLGCTGNDPNLSRLQHLLGMMGDPEKIIACGGPSLGLTAKLSNNYLSGLIAIATAEAMNIGMRSGLDKKVLASVFHASTAQNCISDRFNPVPGVCPEAPSSNGYHGGFKVELMRKDFGLAVDTANRVGAKLVLGQAGLETYRGASDDPRCKGLDSRVVYRYLGGEEG